MFAWIYNETMPTMTPTVFVTELDGPTFTSVQELDQYREWLELCHAGS